MTTPAFRAFGLCALITLGAGCEDKSKTAEEGERAAGKGALSVDGAATGRRTIEGVGFSTPESVLHDTRADVYLVSNIVGSPVEKDGKAFISRLSPQGEVSELKWIDGEADGVTLNAPKGMALSADELWVADIDTVRIFDRESGQPKGEVAIEGALFLNDLSLGGDAVWLTDTGVKMGEGGLTPVKGAAAVYRIKTTDRAVRKVASGDALSGPNGILADDSGAWVASFADGGVYRLDAKGKRGQTLDVGATQLDGLVHGEGGRLFVSSWERSAILSGDPDGGGTFETVAEGLTAPADIGFDAQRGRLLVPLFNDNQVRFHPASGMTDGTEPGTVAGEAERAPRATEPPETR